MPSPNVVRHCMRWHSRNSEEGAKLELKALNATGDAKTSSRNHAGERPDASVTSAFESPLELPRAKVTCKKREKLFIMINFDCKEGEASQPGRDKRCNPPTLGERAKVDIAPTAFSVEKSRSRAGNRSSDRVSYLRRCY